MTLPSTLRLTRTAVVKLAAITILLSIASFLVLGITRLFVGVETAQILAAPLFAAGFLLATALFCVGVLSKVGLVTVAEK